MQRIAPLHVEVKGQRFDFHLGYLDKPSADKARSDLKKQGYEVHTLRVAVSAGPHPSVVRYLYLAHRRKGTRKARLTR